MQNKILIVLPSFRSGGTNTSLKNLSPLLVEMGYDIDVFAITNVGPNREYISKYCNVLGYKQEGLQDISGTERIKSLVAILVKQVKKILDKIGIDISPVVFKKVAAKLEKNKYDIVVAFQEGQPTKLVSYFKNVKKIAWNRSDYSNMLRIAKIKPQKKLYSKIDKIVCVSEYTRNIFVELIPETADKTVALHNYIDYNEIIKKSNALDDIDVRFEYNGFRILSIGRIDGVKRFSSIPEIAFKLKQNGLKFRWYIMGKGDKNEEGVILKNISKFSVKDEIVLLGAKNNPYPYIKEADLLVSTSISEACPNVLNEAKILGTPIVATDFGSVYEFIEDSVNGLISPIETIDIKIGQMISDNLFYKKIKQNISEFEYDNKKIMYRLQYEILS